MSQQTDTHKGLSIIPLNCSINALIAHSVCLNGFASECVQHQSERGSMGDGNGNDDDNGALIWLLQRETEHGH